MKEFEINTHSSISEIVVRDYRAAEVFYKYDIDFSCSGKYPLDEVCQSKGLDADEVLAEIKKTLRQQAGGMVLEFDKWDIDFLADYILNIHHRYLDKALPDTNHNVLHFLTLQEKEFPYLKELEKVLQTMMKEIPPHMRKEEEIIFPYIKQVYHAWRHRESYASLLIRTLRKPVEDVMQGEHEAVGRQLQRIRQITDHYSLPPYASTAHRIAYAKLQELDQNLMQHIHLENNILFPKAIAMETELLLYKD